ncbi:MAG: hypothetical protein JSV30_01110 [Candidatus Omnitrophota bacterium]|nr:MAG: hypothetical protein JSV30_01110 [Candidatus Omnitrophota bacterium]
MDKKLKWFYRISIWMIIAFLSSNILAKMNIWRAAPRRHFYLINYPQYPIALIKAIPVRRYVTKETEERFNKADILLAPAFTLLFAVIAVRLIKVPELFEGED